MRHPFATVEFARGLSHIGEAVDVPEWETAVLLRRCGDDRRDAIGPYPIAVLGQGVDLADGLQRLARLGAVSVVLVLESVLSPNLQSLSRAFDFVRPLKTQYLYDRAVGSKRYSKH